MKKRLPPKQSCKLFRHRAEGFFYYSRVTQRCSHKILSILSYIANRIFDAFWDPLNSVGSLYVQALYGLLYLARRHTTLIYSHVAQLLSMSRIGIA
jgi:hypothetical protein